MTIRRLMLGVAAAALLAPTAGAGAQETLDLGHVGDPGSLYEATAENFAECVAASGKATVQVYGSSQLGSDEEMLQKLKLGQIDFSIPSSVMSSVSPVFGVFEMPYLIKSRDHMKKVRDEKRDTFVEAAAGRGYQILGFWENGFRHVTSNVKPVNVPADLQGIKLRVPKGEWRVKMFQSYGANPTPMAFSEVFTALQTGVIDGQENPLAQIYSGRFQEVQKFMSMTGHVYSPAFLTTSSRNWDGWDDELKTVIQDCATKSSDFAYERSQQMDDELVGKIEEAGVAVNEADKDAFIEASAPIYEEFGSQVEGGQKLVEDIQALAAGS
ncbi:MAG: TRAP transporter substrate-binding protein [Aurantimonas endophytica]|uniref:Tripartite ATP-independent transporter DctP family solute receptor n=1 Tax=Aurantimonas endophytica TaxID=1522175 RepID=A0A7W6MNS8_9HYPH|nr:TRAP transporter substrate-binding protein [Aurantimonas endophytica]MBB4002194.1 tripartite ATP-independent transporter DctP family solute receptor [Aurantimonas endophytica]MCO6402177.1 DctP family TRAP transporter solute-binding subunit [Aurantimonas endophytica]